MNRNEHILTTIAEECAEVAKECAKALRFGLHDKDPFKEDSTPNRDNICTEMAQLMAMIDLAADLGLIPTNCTYLRLSKAYDEKGPKFLAMTEYSKKRGTYDPD